MLPHDVEVEYAVNLSRNNKVHYIGDLATVQSLARVYFSVWVRHSRAQPRES